MDDLTATGEGQLPNFSDQLFWNPRIHISHGEPIEIAFPTSMLKGTYMIRVCGLSGSKQPVSAEKVITVQ
jgi:hypothetical protein